MPTPDLHSRLVVLETKIQHHESNSDNLWESLSKLEMLIVEVKVQNATIIVNQERFARMEERLMALMSKADIGAGEKKAILGFASVFLVPIGGFVFWLIEWMLGNGAKHP